MIQIEMQIKTVSESNSREHWAVKHKRTKGQRGMAFAAVKTALLKSKEEALVKPIIIKFVRIGKRKLDDDNLSRSMKAIRDGVCDALGIDDGSEDLRFHYGQTVGKEYSARVYVC